MTKRETTLVSLGYLWLGALVLRLVYLLLALRNLGIDKLWAFASDTSLYWAVAGHILDFHDLGSYGLIRVGPGYGLILAVFARQVF